MAFFHLIACLLITPSWAAGASLLQRSASRQRSFAGLRYSPQDPAARTLLALDTNSDGRIDPSEVAAFAKAQDLDAAAATQEFSSIDVNGDGVLDSEELQKVLGASAAASPTQLAETAASPAKAAPAAPVETAKVATVQAPVPAAKTVLKAQDQGQSLAEAAVSQTADTTELISEESRASLQKAAQNVAEELSLEEKETNQARQLDRRAAEARADSTALVKQTTQDALDAGVKAAHTKTDELMAKISKLEEQAERAEVRASALRAKSKMEMEEGKQLMAAAQGALAQDN